MSTISEFQYNFKNDSTFRKKSLFIGGSVIGLVVLIGLFIWLNFKPTSLPKKTSDTQSTQKVADTKPVVFTLDFSTTGLVSATF